jgi:acetyltransferase-like isoleucine patch superfamily enzyme
MRDKIKTISFPRILFTRDFYRFLRVHFYSAYHRYRFLNGLRQKFKDVILPDDIIISNPEKVSIGEKSILSNGCSLHTGYNPNEGSISLGKQVILGYHVSLFAGAGKISIGNYTDIGMNAVITTQTRSLEQNPIQNPEDFKHLYDEVIIGDGTLIAANATVLPGTVLGKFCHIVAGSVVQGKYPDYTTLAGNPARALPRITINENKDAKGN